MCVAVFVDCLKLFFLWGLWGLGAAANALTPVGGAAVGAAAGCYINASHALDIIGCVTGALGGGMIGAIAGSIGAPVGAIMGEIADYCLGTMGIAGLFILLWWTDNFDLKTFVGGSVANLLPGINALPFSLTIMSGRCIMKQMAQEKLMLVGAVGVGAISTATDDNQENAANDTQPGVAVEAEPVMRAANGNQLAGEYELTEKEQRP